MDWLMTGYTGRKVSEMCLLTELRDAVLVDIRYSAHSRVPEWRKEHLRVSLGDRYLHVPEWGNVNYNKPLPIEIADFARGFTIVSGLHRNVLLLCVCLHEESCHRGVVAERLRREHGIPCLEYRWPIRDLTAKGGTAMT